MIKQDITTGSNRVSLGLKCGECIHHSKGPAKFEKLCSQLGQETFSEACKEYTPDMIKLARIDKDVMKDMARIAAQLTPAQTRIMAYVFRNIDFVKKAGLEYGQLVVFSISGQDYLDNYVRGRVLGADRTGETVYITSDFETLNKESAFISLLRPAVMTVEEFKIHRSKLLRLKGRISEPVANANSNKRTLLQCLKMGEDQYQILMSKLTTNPEEYVPPMLDAVPKEWIDQRSVESLLDSGTGKRIGRNKKTSAKKGLNYGKPANQPTSGKKSTDGKVFKIERYTDKGRIKR